MDQTELFCLLCCCFASGTYHSVWPAAGSVLSPAVPPVPCKELGVGGQLPNSAAGLQGKAGPTTNGSGACLGLTPKCLSQWPCLVEEFMAGRPREQGLPWLSAPSFAQKTDSEALICITPLTVQYQDTCRFSSTLPACSGVKNSLFVCLHK